MTDVQQRPAAADPDKQSEFMFRVVTEVGATLNTALVVMGDKLGYYRAMVASGPTTAARLADDTNTDEHYTREWLNAQAAGGYVDYDAADGRYWLPPEQAAILTDESSPAYLAGIFQSTLGVLQDAYTVIDIARGGSGLGWHERHTDVHDGTERFFRPLYRASLVGEWLPALDGVVDKLERGARVADVGCGLGASTILMARAFPRSTFMGSDYHHASIEQARIKAEAAGVADRVSFEVAPAQGFSGSDYDLVTTFDALHDMGDPVGAARHVRSALASDGTWMVVEPYAGDRVEDNLTPVGRVYYGASTLLCTPAALAQDVGLALGTQAGPARLRDVVTAGGFSRFAAVFETPFNMVLEVRP